MRPLLSTTLVNGVFGDPALYLDFRNARRAILFDLGELAGLPPRKLLRLTDIFVTHAHMDHFAGFDRVLRVCLGRGTHLRLYGPPGFVGRVEHKLAAYSWNLVGNYPGDFAILAHEIDAEGRLRSARFGSKRAFGRQDLAERRAPDGVLLDEPQFRVRAALLHHGIDCLGLAFEEKAHVNVWKNRLVEMGLAIGPWLRELKRLVADGAADATPVRAWWRDRDGEHERWTTLGEVKLRALEIVPGQKLAYVTDILYHERNEARVARLAANADVLFIESVFLDEHADHAARKNHLTAAQAGRIARAAGAKAVTPFHFSPRYVGREAELRGELERARVRR